ncbi:MAG: IS1380 family transposase [bacterium]
MKPSRSDVHRRTHAIPAIRFEEQDLTSFSGLVLFQALFSKIDFKQRLQSCFNHLTVSPIFGHHVIVLLLVVHLLLGYRQLRDLRYYADDPMVKRLLGLDRLPDVSTVSRALLQADARSVEKTASLNRFLVLEDLKTHALCRVTLDFDGSVQSTRRLAEGTAVGFNKKRKGDRSYYPLFCTIAQTGQVFDVLHRPGNVHDSRGARDFILRCIRHVREALPGVVIEARMDSAFFSDEIVGLLDAEGVVFTLSVPFERFTELKTMIEGRLRWRRFGSDLAFFETRWKPQSWSDRYRFLFIRHTVDIRSKEPVQFDLFVPHQRGYDFKVIVTNKHARAKKILAFHNGRGAQEALFAELKSQCQMGYVPVRTLVGNQIYLCSAILAHNLTRTLQMQANPPLRNTTEKRSPLWIFQEINTLRRNLIQRAARLIHPQGRLTLSMSANDAVRRDLLHYLAAFDAAA